jgi:acetyl-CoA C-acetyltransferase
MKSDYILCKAFGFAVAGQQGMLRDYYDFTHFDEVRAASKMAYEIAGIKNPREEVSCAEVHDCFSITELIVYEDMGWSQVGKAKDDIESGFFTLEGGLPVNTDGGLKCFGHPIGASGVRMIYEEYLQLRGKAGPRQVKDPKFGVTHNLGGLPGSFTCAVSVWGSRD